jgi:hypothetical protein
MGSSLSRPADISGEPFNLPDLRRVTLAKKEPVNYGGYTDVYRGVWNNGRVRTEVLLPP